jgi:hypothetical protein
VNGTSTRFKQIRDWIDALLAYCEDVIPEDVDASSEAITSVTDADGGTVVSKNVTCGTETCTCQRGELHGPSKYVVRRQGDRLQWEYKGPVSV